MINLPKEFVPGYRYHNVYGTRSADAKFDVCIDGELVHNIFANIEQFDTHHLNLGPAQYTFTTKNSFFGAIPIRINMSQGSMTLTQARVFYPAKITNLRGGNVYGYYSMFQPIGDPKCIVRINGQLQKLEEQDRHLTGEIHYNITAGDILEYYHIMADGPDYWWIGHHSMAPDYIIDEQDPRIDFRHFDNFDRINILRKQLMIDYKNSSCS